MNTDWTVTLAYKDDKGNISPTSKKTYASRAEAADMADRCKKKNHPVIRNQVDQSYLVFQPRGS